MSRLRVLKIEIILLMERSWVRVPTSLGYFYTRSEFLTFLRLTGISDGMGQAPVNERTFDKGFALARGVFV